MNRERLLALCDVIEAAAVKADAGKKRAVGFDMAHFAKRSECGTSCCAAGHAVRMAHPRLRFIYELPECGANGEAFLPGGRKVIIAYEASTFLGLTYGEGETLFNSERWRDKARKAYTSATSNLGRASAFRDQVEHMLRREGA